jgi:hypothetical protein
MISVILNIMTLLVIAIFSVFLYVVYIKNKRLKEIDSIKEIQALIKEPITQGVYAPAPELGNITFSVPASGHMRYDHVHGADLEVLENSPTPSSIDFQLN